MSTETLQAKYHCRINDGGCGATPGSPCRTRAGKPTSPHAARRREDTGAGQAEARWNDAVDWLLNSRHTADPAIQRAFWGIVDGEFGREQADNGVFPELTDRTR